MIINVKKEKEDIVLSLIINGTEEPFDYVRLVNELYNKNKIEKINYSNEINEWEKEEIEKLINEINSVIKQSNKE